jgi:hypothetical protein
MGILRKATEEVKTIALDETDYIVVRADISKREFNALAGAMPPVGEGGAGLSVAQASDFQKSLFESLVVGWSLYDGTPKIEDYETLSAEAGLVVDTKLAEHFESLLPSSAEGK